VPSLSVVIPAHNEGRGLTETVHSILDTRSLDWDLEFVIADDQSTDGGVDILRYEFPKLNLRVLSSTERLGVARARNLAARAAQGDTLFITDGHVRFVTGWDEIVGRHMDSSVILAATIRDPLTGASGYGCRLVVPFMGTYWNCQPRDDVRPVQIASAAGTVVSRKAFQLLGGYDDGMRIYGGAEPEFSVRAWLSGFEIRSVPSLVIEHTFKSADERRQLTKARRVFLVHNSVRFGLLYLSEAMVLRTIRLLACEFPEGAGEAFRMVEASDVYQRRSYLDETLTFPFSWFVERFDLKDQVGYPIALQ
jgi:glycosyltransferase involved in cell wall biosynthesis